MIYFLCSLSLFPSDPPLNCPITDYLNNQGHLPSPHPQLLLLEASKDGDVLGDGFDQCLSQGMCIL